MTTPAHYLARSRGFLVVEDVDLIQEAVRTLPQDRTVFVADLGAGSGTTALSVFCERAEDMIVITVDHDEVALNSTRQCMTNAGFVENWRPFYGKTPEIARVLGFSSDKAGPLVDLLDMLMVDADHSYEGVKADLEAWLPFVKDGAPVWCHDYTQEYPGSMQAIDEAIASGALELVKTAGWGILCRKAAQS